MGRDFCLCYMLNPSACSLFIFKHPSRKVLVHVTCNKASVSKILWFALLRKSQLLRAKPGNFTMADENTWFWGCYGHDDDSYENYNVYRIG